MIWERRMKGTQSWQQITEAEARSELTHLAEIAALERGESAMTPAGVVRRRPEPEQPNLPGVAEGEGAYGTLRATPEALQASLQRIRELPGIDEGEGADGRGER